MKGCSHNRLAEGKRPWKTCVVVALGVAVVVLAVALPTVLCWPATGCAVAENSSVALARLEEVLAVTNESLAEARRQWDDCRTQLGVLEGKAAELEQVLATVTELQEKDRVLQAKLAQQQEQLGDLQRSRDELRLQNLDLQKQLQDTRRQHSGGNGLPAVSLSLLALLPGVLLL